MGFLRNFPLARTAPSSAAPRLAGPRTTSYLHLICWRLKAVSRGPYALVRGSTIGVTWRAGPDGTSGADRQSRRSRSSGAAGPEEPVCVLLSALSERYDAFKSRPRRPLPPWTICLAGGSGRRRPGECLCQRPRWAKLEAGAGPRSGQDQCLAYAARIPISRPPARGQRRDSTRKGHVHGFPQATVAPHEPPSTHLRRQSQGPLRGPGAGHPHPALQG